MLWHRGLGHTLIERIKRLIKDGILKTLDFINLCTFVDCFKGKHTNKTKKGGTRSSKITHTYICGPCLEVCLNGMKYFISFIDNYSRYTYLYFFMIKVKH